jgi:hypothetical protein
MLHGEDGLWSKYVPPCDLVNLETLIKAYLCQARERRFRAICALFQILKHRHKHMQVAGLLHEARLSVSACILVLNTLLYHRLPSHFQSPRFCTIPHTQTSSLRHLALTLSYDRTLVSSTQDHQSRCNAFRSESRHEHKQTSRHCLVASPSVSRQRSPSLRRETNTTRHTHHD